MFRLTQSFLVLGIALTAAGSDKVPTGLSASDWSSIRAEYERSRHAAYSVGNEYHAHNAGQQWLTRFDERGFVLQPNAGGWQWGLALESYGFSGRERAVKAPAQVTTDKERITYTWDNTLEEWFVNDRRGLEHGFTLWQRPEGGLQPARGFSPALQLQLSVRGGLRPQVQPDGLGVTFQNAAGQSVLQYAGLKSWDADGKPLPSQLATHGDGLRFQLDDRGARYPITIDPIVQQAYLKASNTGARSAFGRAVAISGDTVVVGSPSESSGATGVNGDQTNPSGTCISIERAPLATPTPTIGPTAACQSGAVYVFVRNGGAWTQQAYLKASNTGANDQFGSALAISGDTVVVGAPFEASNATGINGNQTNNSFANAGAAYVFVRNGSSWAQQAYLKASNTAALYRFGTSVGISDNTVVVGSVGESSNATTINGDEFDTSASNSGAAYVFVRNGSTWTQQAYLKASNAGAFDNFGTSVSISGDTVVAGAVSEGSNATGVNGDGSNNNAASSGAAYVFTRDGSTWTQQAYLKASNTGASDVFGSTVAVSGDTVVVGATGEDSNAIGVNGNQSDESSSGSGAAYAFVRASGQWSQQAYLKASNTGSSDNFGGSVGISGDTVVVGARLEDSNATGIDGNGADNSAANSGAAYVFVRNSTVWTPKAYLKPSNTGAGDSFGLPVAVAGDTVVVGAITEDSNATGIGGNGSNNSAADSGAAYIFYSPSPCGTGRSIPAGKWTMFSLPCVADSPSTVSSVFSGVKGTYGTDWVAYERDETNNKYTKLDLNSPLSQGNGYWFKSASTEQFSVSGTSTPVTTSSDCASPSGCFEITLTKPANADGLYNLAGHPFPTNIDWANVRVVADSGSAASPSQAETNGDMSKTYWNWNGSSYDSYDDSTPGLVGQLQSTYGMWVKVLDPALTSINLLIPASSDTTKLAGIAKKGTLKATEWYVRLVAEVAAEGLKDSGNVLGQLKDSKPGFDSHDLPELAPSFTPYLTVAFPHVEWATGAGDYASDFHKPKVGADTWAFVVRTDVPTRQVRLSWEVSGKAPANMSLKDMATRKTVPLKSGSYTFVMGSKERAFTWSVR